MQASQRQNHVFESIAIFDSAGNDGETNKSDLQVILENLGRKYPRK